jgi:predicted nucleic acid-binding protein
MDSPLVLVDTCIWIDFFRHQDSLLGNHLAYLIKHDRAAVCGVVCAELLQGVKRLQEETSLYLVFDTVSLLTTHETDWLNAGKQLQALRRSGLTIPLTDALIASIARRYRIPVFTIDKHFQHLDISIHAP